MTNLELITYETMMTRLKLNSMIPYFCLEKNSKEF